ncbi:MAG: type VI secretion system baseplate subunit TssE [Nitrospira sp.]|nr:type VI secretion system baseplate subunit TssE [Nitrospira sp.]
MAKREEEGGLAASILDRLLDDDPRAGDPRIDSLDLKNIPSLLKKLQSGNDPLARYIRDQAYPEDLATLDHYDGATPAPHPVVAAMVDILNRVILGPFLYERQRFGNVRLSAETLTLMEDSRKSKNVSSFNRMLLDEAYADELEKMRKPAPSSLSLRELRASVARDIETLLNTRRELLFDLPQDMEEVRKSILLFGLPDFTSYSLLNPQDRKSLRRAVEEALVTFEPRLKSVRVTLETREKYDTTLRFRIDALLRTDPAPEPITLDASLSVVTNQYTVRGDL